MVPRAEERLALSVRVDTLLGLSFLIDVLGNTLDLYDSISWWDDINHYVNWAILSGALGWFLVRLPLACRVTFGLVVGFGATRQSCGRSSSISRSSATRASSRRRTRTRSGISAWACSAR